MTEVTYNQFRSLHKGTPQKKVSKLWKKYKDGKYKLPTPEEPVIEEPVIEEPVIEEPVIEEVAEEPLKEVPKKPKRKAKKPKKTEPTPMDKCTEYERYRRELSRFSFKYNEEETTKILKRMSEYAKDTIPEGYTCEATDSWKIWFGPSERCLLINTTRRVAFKVDRGWWQKHYQTTIYVDRELLKSNDLMDKVAKQYSILKRYIPRTPVVGLECKLPQGVKDIQMRGGHAGDR